MISFAAIEKSSDSFGRNIIRYNAELLLLLSYITIIIICSIAFGKMHHPATASDKLCPSTHRIQGGVIITECGVIMGTYVNKVARSSAGLVWL